MMRRDILKKLCGGLLVIGMGLSVGISQPAIAAEPVKVVYHFADGTDQATRGLANIRNHLRADPDARIVVVALGEGIRFLLQDGKDSSGKPFDTAVAALAAKGVDFRICNNSLTAHGIPMTHVLPQAKVVPSGVVEVARLQAKEGFVYLRP